MSVNIFKNGILSKIAGAVGDAVPLINNFLTNQEGKGAADANTVYVLNNKIEEVNSSLVANIYVGEDGKLHKVQGGADSVLPFSSYSKIFFPIENISNIKSISVNSGMTCIQNSNGTYHMTTTAAYSTSRYVKVVIDVTNINYIIVGVPNTLTPSISGATTIYLNCIYVSTLTGEQTLMLSPISSQGKGGEYDFQFIIGF